MGVEIAPNDGAIPSVGLHVLGHLLLWLGRSSWFLGYLCCTGMDSAGFCYREVVIVSVLNYFLFVSKYRAFCCSCCMVRFAASRTFWWICALAVRVVGAGAGSASCIVGAYFFRVTKFPAFPA
ncbi:uncharacterized protein LOC130702674 isoform X1 [Daphnia carinata]|uniref:uncharacterized protein LOC130702674 isoform X1 n=1 Tax=Daphnia carinata TaxID=120202 RepID=UPI0025808879|nr:uncharacterized protein LOC130702674 isoform X1 [Daphnia carinata]